MTESDGRSKKALLVAVVLVMIVGAGGWFAFNRSASSPATLLAAPLAHPEPTAATAATGGAPVSATTSAEGRAPIAAPAGAGVHADSANASGAAKQKPAPAHESTPRLEPELATPAIPASVDVDAVTRGIEQSTKAKIDSAGKPRIDVKPIFKKP